MVAPAPAPRFCASCTSDDDGTLEPTEIDGRIFQLCWRCREGSVSLFSFSSTAEKGDWRQTNCQVQGRRRGGSPTRSTR